MWTRSKSGIFALMMVAATGTGCARHETMIRTQTHKTIAAPAETQWGPLAEGLQCRLRPNKRVCPVGESPAFHVDLGNHGRRVFAFLRGDQAPVRRFAIDGQWRPWPGPAPTDGKVQALSPGAEILDLPATLPADARTLLTPGRHVVQLALSFEGVEVVSNSVEIEVVGSRR